MVEGWARGGQGLGYGWVGVGWVGCMGWGKRVGIGVGLGYGGLGDGGRGMRAEGGRDWGVYGCFGGMGKFGVR